MAYPSLGTSVSANGATSSVTISANVAVLTVNETTTATPRDQWSVHLQYSVDSGTSWKDTQIVVGRTSAVRGHQFVLPASGVICRAYVNGLAGSVLDIDIT